MFWSIDWNNLANHIPLLLKSCISILYLLSLCLIQFYADEHKNRRYIDIRFNTSTWQRNVERRARCDVIARAFSVRNPWPFPLFPGYQSLWLWPFSETEGGHCGAHYNGLNRRTLFYRDREDELAGERLPSNRHGCSALEVEVRHWSQGILLWQNIEVATLDYLFHKVFNRLYYMTVVFNSFLTRRLN